MNDQIEIMIELQKLWDNVLKNRDGVSNYNKRIIYYNDEINDKASFVNELEGKIKNLKSIIKKYELDLKDKDDKFSKLMVRKELIKSERELDAQNTELVKLQKQRDELENILIKNFDELENLERTISDHEKEYVETSKMCNDEIIKLKLNIEQCQLRITENENKFNSIIDKLIPHYRSKFIKLINSKNGIGIGKINGEVCSSCNFQIPPSLAKDAGMHDIVANCTNCSRFIYKIKND